MAASPARVLHIEEPLDRTTIREAISQIEGAERALSRIDLRRLRGNKAAQEAVRIVRTDLRDLRLELVQVI